MPQQPDFFGFTKPRAKPQVRANIIDAGAGMTKPHMGRFECQCGWRSDWIEFKTVKDGKRGIPCPSCNSSK